MLCEQRFPLSCIAMSNFAHSNEDEYDWHFSYSRPARRVQDH